MKTLIAIVSALAAIIATPVAVYAWGSVGHYLTAEAAALRMPAAMPAFFRAATRQLTYLNPEPDRWRDSTERALDPALDGATAPDHFVDMEMVPRAVLAAALAAPNRYAYLDTLAAAGVRPVAMGLLPYRILELSQRLRSEFRLWRAASDSTRPWIEARIINDAGVLGHYIADGSNPTHTSIHYNGWSGPNPRGYATDRRLHSRFESDFVNANITLADVVSRVDSAATVFPDLRAAVVAYLEASNALIEQLYQIDKANRFEAGTAAPANKEFTAARLAAGARMLRDVWWTAWVTSAPRVPDPPR